jgi:hypothetical protein
MKGSKAMEKMPEKINVIKVVTYDLQKISDDMFEATGLRPIHVAEAVDWIEPWVIEDFGGGQNAWAPDLKDLIFQDENGEDL